MRDKHIIYYILVGAVFAALAFYGHKSEPPIEHSISLSEQRAEHILYGDERGGGHLYGVGVPCKSEFPESWDGAKILGTIKRIAANDNPPLKQESNGYYTREVMIEGVNVRVVLGREKQSIITGYPINLPRNPCPANDR